MSDKLMGLIVTKAFGGYKVGDVIEGDDYMDILESYSIVDLVRDGYVAAKSTGAKFPTLFGYPILSNHLSDN